MDFFIATYYYFFLFFPSFQPSSLFPSCVELIRVERSVGSRVFSTVALLLFSFTFARELLFIIVKKKVIMRGEKSVVSCVSSPAAGEGR